ncbi:MAG: HAMP domain-containing histidine kinase, partial [Acidimicrobiia bacterium]|nr:HAMP domain-containing histidine kinase [Acidimicrobiia bacterium]
ALLVTRVNGVLELTETEWRTIESVVREAILNKVAWTVVIVLAVLFFASLVVGWLVAGRALRPLSRITQVAQDIEATDLSRRIALAGPDDELTRMAATFDSMLDRLDRAFSSQKDRLARTSHDLRTPLAIIRSNLDVTMSDPSTTVDDWRQTGAIALRASERMSTMIDDLLAAARMEAGSPTLVNVDLATLARTVVGDFDAKASGEGVQLVLSARPALVLGDRLALSRAMENVIDNAISVAAGKVVVGTGRVEDWGYLSVTDDGPGVDPAVVRGERPAEGRFGLAIVREIARLHGGSVDARKLKSGGSVVAVWLPLGAGTGSDRPPMSALDSL